MTDAAISAAILSVSAFVLHALLGLAAPFAAALVERVADGAPSGLGGGRTGRRAGGLLDPLPAARLGFGSWRGREPITAPGGGPTGPALQVLAATSLAAWLLVPSFARASLVAPSGDMLLLALLLAIGGGAGLVASAEDDPAAIEAAPMVSLGLVLVPAALMLAGSAASLIGGPRLDQAVGAAPGAPLPATVLLALALGVAALADLPAFERLDRGLSGAGRAVFRLALSLRLLIWLDLVAGFCPPATTISALAGPVAWLVALLLWAVKIAVASVLFGFARRALQARGRTPERTAYLFGTSCLFGLLACLFVLIRPAVA